MPFEQRPSHDYHLGAIGRSILDYLKIAGYFEGLFIAAHETFLHSPSSFVPAHPACRRRYVDRSPHG
jgi:hypothetical protein